MTRRGDKTCAERDAAKQAGEARYSTGRPCIRGHIAERYTAGGACVECTRETNQDLHRSRSDERKRYMRTRGRVARTGKDTWAAEVIRAARGRAKRIGVEFDLRPEDLTLPDVCPALGVQLIYDRMEPKSHRPSLDRTDNRKGYVRGNVRVISFRANQIKNDASADELRALAEYVHATMFEEAA